ncbi:TIGR00454 family protein [Archaeoglobus neptunius]|uniref:TIGR00454 family protein n=1 Tax=Archaeoglobus neptunius TaxID=2798580 RepID=UPI001928C8EF|nr:TIGR00454 family protein [Archaeoglobus neptunius]
MNALLMCGGKGTRLGSGEKPLFEVCGKKLVDHAIYEFDNFEIVAVTSPNTPQTEKYLDDFGIDYYRASGKGFIEDYREACTELSICEPVVVACTDLIYLKRGIPEKIVEAYLKSPKRALAVYVDSSPAGINIIDAFFIDEEQEEEIYILGRNSIVNINTVEDVKRAEELWTTMKGGRGSQKG